MQTVIIYGRRGKERLSAYTTNNAESKQAAIAEAVTLDALRLNWYSITYRQELGVLDDSTPGRLRAEIVGYEVLE